MKKYILSRVDLLIFLTLLLCKLSISNSLPWWVVLLPLYLIEAVIVTPVVIVTSIILAICIVIYFFKKLTR